MYNESIGLIGYVCFINSYFHKTIKQIERNKIYRFCNKILAQGDIVKAKITKYFWFISPHEVYILVLNH